MKLPRGSLGNPVGAMRYRLWEERAGSGQQVLPTPLAPTRRTHPRNYSCLVPWKEEGRKSTTRLYGNKEGNQPKRQGVTRRRHVHHGQGLCGSVRQKSDHSTMESGSSGPVGFTVLGASGPSTVVLSFCRPTTFVREREGAEQGSSPEPSLRPAAFEWSRLCVRLMLLGTKSCHTAKQEPS